MREKMVFKSAVCVLWLFVLRTADGVLLDGSDNAGACTDSDSLDCPTVNLTSNICGNVPMARTLCPKFCGYCNISDGQWTSWSPWTPCDVTCDNGTHVKNRTCTNPAPTKPYGKDCVGSARDVQPCYNTIQCPIHGEWGQWSSWLTCSQTCGTGLQRRDRHCDHPYPSLHGDHCFGEPITYRICMERACSDGGWSLWGQWSTCSFTCGNGFRTRDRLCNNPPPSVAGTGCQGNSQMVSQCYTGRCRDVMSAFSVSAPLSFDSGYLTFSNTIYNYGGDYSVSTGIFTCSKPGLYQFSVSLTKARASTRIDRVYCRLYKGTIDVLFIATDPTDDDTDKGSYSASNSALLHLNRGDTVDLHSCTGIDTMESWSSFMGFLLYADP